MPFMALPGIGCPSSARGTSTHVTCKFTPGVYRSSTEKHGHLSLIFVLTLIMPLKCRPPLWKI